MTVFYRTYRPQKLEEIIGQPKVVEMLFSQLKSGKISHGYLFAGPRGTGKTSTARILAKAVNCSVYNSPRFAKATPGEQLTVHGRKKIMNRELKTDNRFGEPCNKCESCLAIVEGSHLDLFEIDAASNRGIDEIRDLREKIKLSPVMSRFKVYIIDEAHMLTNEAFNAFLKTLEEPPAHAIFILCTTHPAKLPPTIISRLSRFNFSRAREEDLERAIEKIVKEEKIKIDEKALMMIAKVADGSFRDAISILDQLASGGKKIEEKDVVGFSMGVSQNNLLSFFGYLAEGRLVLALEQVEKLVNLGVDMGLFVKEMLLFSQKLLYIKLGAEFGNWEVEPEIMEKMRNLAARMRVSDLQNLMKLLLICEQEAKYSPLPQIPLVLALTKFLPPAPAQPENLEMVNSGKLTRPIKLEDVHIDEVTHYDHESIQPKSKTKTNKKALVKMAQVEKKWAEFLSRVKPINAHIVALLRSTKPVSVDGESLIVEVYYRFHKEKLEEPKIYRMLSDVLSELLATKLNLKFILVVKKKDDVPSAVKRSDVVEVGNFGLEEVAQEIFSK